MAKATRQRIPKLRYTSNRGIGWHVSYRDDTTQRPTRLRFGIAEREREPDARALYHAWLARHLGGNGDPPPATNAKLPTRHATAAEVLSGSIIEVASSLIEIERTRVRKDGDPRRRGSITVSVFRDRNKQIHDFLEFLNDRHGAGAVAKFRLADLTLEDVEAYNRFIVTKGFSASQVSKRMQRVRAIINRAGRSEHGRQVLSWNWDARDVSHGIPARERTLPTLSQLRRLLKASDVRGRALIWLGIGLGLGARDIASIRVGQIASDAYDLRRGKTGVERYGETPYLIWLYVSKLQTKRKRLPGQPLFITRQGMPLVHANTNAVTLWWQKLRRRAGETKKTLPGFYTLRHLGATEFGSRPGASIGEVKRWLGHSASSHMADLYMRPVKPEYRALVKWVRRKLTRKPPTNEPR